MRFIFEQIKTGGDRNFGYLLGDREKREGVLIDPSYQPELLFKRAEDQGLSITHILNTHGHGDHTNGNDQAQELLGAPIAIYKESPVPHDKGLEDGEIINVGDFELKVIYTPGHSGDHCVFYNKEFQVALTGDHLFVGKIGGTSSEETSRDQYDSFQKLYEQLAITTTIWPGHDYGCRPCSTLYLEKQVNPFLLASNVGDFLETKQKWSDLKKKKGLM